MGAGTVVTWTGGYSPVARIAVVDARGRELRQIGPPAPYHDIDVDPSGRRIAIERGDQKSVVPSIWLMDVASGQSSVLAAPAEGGGTPRWIPGTTDVIYSTFTARALVRQSTTSSESRSFPAPTAWMTDVSPDGRTALFLTSRPGTGEDVLQVALEADGGLSPFLAGPMGERSAVISPDAQWVAYASDESGRSEVSVEAYPGRGRKQVVSSGGGHQPQWSADGRTLYYLTDDSAFVAAAVERRGGSLSFSPRRLFRLPAIVNLNDVRQTYEPLRDGTFLVILKRDEVAQGSLRVGLNWAAQ